MAEYVTVCSKVPTGLHLDLQTVVKGVTDGAMGPMVQRERFATLKGCELPRGADYANGAEYPRIEEGFSLTPNVDKAKFEMWLEQNKDNPWVTNGLIFAHTNANSAKAEAREKGDIKTGFEPLDPRDPGPRLKPEQHAAA